MIAVPKGKGVYLYVLSYLEGANQNVIWPVYAPERQAWAERITDAIVAASMTHVLIKVADGISPYNRRRKTAEGKVVFNSTLPDAVDDCPLVVQALQKRGIKVYGWQFIYGQNSAAEAAMAIQRINELNLDGWVVNAEYAHKSYLQNGKEIDGYKLDRRKASQELARPPAWMELRVGEYMAALRAETRRLSIPLFLSSYKYPSSHPSFPFAAFLEYCDGNMPQVYPIGDNRPNAHTIQLVKSLREYREIAPEVPIYPTGGAFSESYIPYGQSALVSWVATGAQVTDFFEACEREGLQAANIWEMHAAKNRFPDLWVAAATYPWPVEEPVIIEPTPIGAGDPLPQDPESLFHYWRRAYNAYRIRMRH